MDHVLWEQPPTAGGGGSAVVIRTPISVRTDPFWSEPGYHVSSPGYPAAERLVGVDNGPRRVELDRAASSALIRLRFVGDDLGDDFGEDWRAMSPNTSISSGLVTAR